MLSKKSLTYITGIYCRIISPNHLKRSAKRYIHPLILCETSLYKANANVIYRYLAQEYNRIKQTGIYFTENNIPIFLNLDIGYFSFDSKEASFVLGMKQSFNHQYCCRFCVCPRSNFGLTFIENSSHVRTEDSFKSNAQTALSFGSNGDQHGICHETYLRHFNSEYLYTIAPPCIAHDIFEGVCIKLLKATYSYFFSKNYITDNFLDIFLDIFSLKGQDKQYFPLIKFSSSSSIRLTAIESYTFFRFYLLIINTSVPSDDPVRNIIELFVQFLNIIMIYSGPEYLSSYMNTLVHDILYLINCHLPNEIITLKYHHLIHYGRIFSLFGPLRYLSTINFEAMHSGFKTSIRSSKNWKNPVLTIGNKYARETCLNSEPKIVYESFTPSFIPLAIQELLDNNLDHIRSTKSLNINGKNYKINQVVFFKRSERTYGMLISSFFFKINQNSLFMEI